MDVNQKLGKLMHQAMHELELFRDRLESFGRELVYSSHELLQLGKRTLKDYHSVVSLITIQYLLVCFEFEFEMQIIIFINFLIFFPFNVK